MPPPPIPPIPVPFPFPVNLGGTGATTITGLVKAAGTSAFTAATAGTDYCAPATASTWTNTQTLSGSSSVLASVMTNIAETATVTAGAPAATVNYYISSQTVWLYTSNAANNWVINISHSAGTTLNTALSTGQSVSLVMLVTEGGTAYYNTSVQVDGTTTGVTTKWQNGITPTSGNINGIDVYTYTVIKTAASTYTVLASQTKFA
jgi:hypothetical protein